ncbi:TonB-dependent receptor [Kordiimonas sediminis]|uniref:TonB-dependent receptor n=1 Tax=Kordiimonas sediminis TaxID=1735581 RepID=A0A919E5A4_9PROT|nr:TonB-dependent receptor [Kordiimonas sediminis]GHF13548.1 TonB-dependent receptor [Kordiimonas sediminis]
MKQSGTNWSKLAGLLLAGSCLQSVPVAPLYASAGSPPVAEISVTAERTQDRALPTTSFLSEDEIAVKAPAVLTDILQAVPGIGIRVNSRGEAVLRLRGSEERQSQVFVDGAPISVPWDGRSDLGLLPADIVQSVAIIKSTAPIEFGTNAILGVVDVATLSPDSNQLKARAEIGTLGRDLLSSSIAYRFGGDTKSETGTGVVASVSRYSQDADPVADRDAVPFDPLAEDGRTNTDMARDSYYAKLMHDGDRFHIQASLMHIEAEKAIAAAAHLNPETEKPRFWRYPEWSMTQITGNGEFLLGERLDLSVTAWQQWFDQTIHAYESLEYDSVTDIEEGDSSTRGARLVLTHIQDSYSARFVASLQDSTYKERATTPAESNTGDRDTYQQKLSSLGIEIDIPFGANVKLSSAVAYDRASTPLTGGRDKQPAMDDWAFSTSLSWQVSNDWSLLASLGKRTRFPTMRELYGTAIGQFLLNPDLGPETVFSADVTASWTPEGSTVSAFITPWYNSIDDTLSRRNVIIDGTRMRQRYNLNGSEGYGIEAGLRWDLTAAVTFDSQLFWQHLQAKKNADGSRDTLYQRPEWQGLVALDFAPMENLTLRSELNMTGSSKDEGLDGLPVSLGSSAEINLRAQYQVTPNLMVYSSVVNLTNTLVLPQLGLPLPGRVVKAGISVTL